MVFIFTFTMYNLNSPTYFNKLFASIGEAPANSAFKDKDFYYCVIDQYNIQNSTSKAYTDSLTDEEFLSITSLDCSGKGIEDASGIEKLTNLTSLNLRGGSYQLSNINLSQNKKLITLNLGDNNLLSIDLSNNTALETLSLYNNYLTEIDLSNNINLTELVLDGNRLTSIDLSNNTLLTELVLGDDYLTSINLNNNVNLTSLDLSDSNLTNIDLSKNIELISLNLENNGLLSINIKNNKKLEYLNLAIDSYAVYNKLTEIDLSNNINLKELELYNNNLTSIDLSNNTALESLNLSENNLTSIDLSNNVNLTNLYLDYNNLESIDLSSNIALTSLEIGNNPLIDDEILLQVGETYEIKDINITLPEGKNLTYEVSGSDIISIDGKKVTALSEGEEEIEFYVNGYNCYSGSDEWSIFSTKITVGNIVLESYEKELIVDNEKKYVYSYNFETNYIYDMFELEEYIYTNFGEIVLEDNKIKVVQNDKTYLEYDFVYLETGYANRSLEYFILTSYNSSPNKYNIKAVNCTYEIEDDEIIVKYKDEEIDRRKVINLYLPDNYYVLGNLFIINPNNEKIDISMFNNILSVDDINNDKINVLNAKAVIDEKEGDLIFRDSNNEWVCEIQTMNIISKTYDLSNDYIYLGKNEFVDDIKIFNFGDNEDIDGMLRFIMRNNYLYLKDVYMNFDRLDLIKVTSEEYNIEDDKIDLKGKDVDLSKIDVTNAKLELKNDKLLVKYNDEVVKELEIVNKKVNTTTKVTTTTKKETTTSKNNESSVTTKKDITTKKKTTTKKESIIDKIFKKDTTSKEDVTTKTTTKEDQTITTSSTIENNNTSNTNKINKSTIKTTTKVEENKNSISNKIKNGIRMLKNASKPMIILLSIISAILLIYIIILLKKKNKEDES